LPAGVLAALSLIPILITTGCAAAQGTPDVEAVSAVYTAVAQTVAAASASVSPTATPATHATATGLPSTSTALPTSTATSASAYTYSSGCLYAVYLSDVTVPDGEGMAPGEYFTKTWKMLNSGSCSWNKNYSVVLVDGTDMGADSAALETTVEVGASADVSVELTAPEEGGTYTGYWRLADAGGTLFGEQFYVQIVVSGDPAPDTPSPTTEPETPSPTATATPMAEPATLTPEPTHAADSTPTSGSAGMTSPPTENRHDRETRS